MTNTSKINRNQALGTSFKLDIPGLEQFNYFVQETEIPALAMAGVNTPFQNYQTNVPSNRIEFSELPVTFLVDEDYSNYMAFYEWFVNISMSPNVVGDELKSIVLHNLNSTKAKKFTLEFKGAYPTFLGRIPLSNSVSDTPSITCAVRFRYQYFQIKKVNEELLPR